MKMPMEAAGMDENGNFHFNEFLSATLHVNKTEPQDRLNIAPFQHFDTDYSGPYIEIFELRAGIESLN